MIQQPSPLESSTNKTLRKLSLITLGIVVAVRIITLGFPDLVDTTEGRYAGVAQLMLSRGDWVTPWIDFHGEVKPYLGKPPLHFWLEQISFLVLGQNSFAARLPSLISGIGIVLTVGMGLSALVGMESALVGATVLATSCLMYFLSGAVVLDVTLTLGITVALVSFLLAHQYKLARYTFFAGMGLGVLVKGPLATVLVGATIIPWLAVYRFRFKSWPKQLTAIPWFRGILVFFVIVLPWYIWAEIRNPGFLEYFLWNENFGRYLKSDYGDEYGSGHRQPFGACFGMMLLACFPWSLIGAFVLVTKRKQIFQKDFLNQLFEQPLIVYALAWSLSCPLLLLGARQYTGTYLLPSVPGFAFLIGVIWHNAAMKRRELDSKVTSILSISVKILAIVTIVVTLGTLFFQASVTWIAPIVLIQIVLIRWLFQDRTSSAYRSILCLGILTSLLYGGVTLGLDNYLSENRSAKRILLAAQALPQSSDGTVCLFFPYKPPFSASFYSATLEKPSITVISSEDTPESINLCPYIVARLKDKDVPKLHREIGTVQEIKRIGRWRIFKRR